MRQLMDTIQVIMCHHFTNNRKESSSLLAAAVVQPQFKLSASAVRRMQHNLCSKHQS
jgi:hypothetical protein